MENRTAPHLFNKLLGLSRRLRGPKGCPWDKAQTHASLKGDLIEEAYEVAEAIDEKNEDKFMEELGDLLYQVIFHSRIAEERHSFTMEDIMETVYEKMVRRHPHVFDGSKKARSKKEILARWQEIKLAEKNHRNHAGLMKEFSKALPALLRARAVQERARRVGFEWPDAGECFKKLIEEVNELKKVLKNAKRERIEDEIGDVLFTLVNLSRFLKVNSEETLQRATDKFIRRFEAMEKELAKKGKKLSELSLKDMDLFWEKAKTKLLQ